MIYQLESCKCQANVLFLFSDYVIVSHDDLLSLSVTCTVS